MIITYLATVGAMAIVILLLTLADGSIDMDDMLLRPIFFGFVVVPAIVLAIASIPIW